MSRINLVDPSAATGSAAGLDDEEIVEVLAHIALNLFTNYVNVALDVPVDFPNVRPKRAA